MDINAWNETECKKKKHLFNHKCAFTSVMKDKVAFFLFDSEQECALETPCFFSEKAAHVEMAQFLIPCQFMQDWFVNHSSHSLSQPKKRKQL